MKQTDPNASPPWNDGAVPCVGKQNIFRVRLASSLTKAQPPRELAPTAAASVRLVHLFHFFHGDSTMSDAASYATIAVNPAGVRITTKPARVLPTLQLVIVFLVSTFELIMLYLLAGIYGVMFFAATGWLFFMWATRWGEKNEGRRVCSFEVNPAGISLEDGTQLAKEDIALLHMVAPVSSGLTGTVVERAWRIEAEVRGNTYTLAGGLTQSVARGVLHEIGKVMK